MIGRKNRVVSQRPQDDNQSKIPKHHPLPLVRHLNILNEHPYKHVAVAEEGGTHLLMLRKTDTWGLGNRSVSSLKSRRKKLENVGIKVKNNGTFIAHVVGYEGLPYQITVRNPTKKENQITKLRLYGVNHVWNLTYPNGLKTHERPYLRLVLKKQPQTSNAAGNIYYNYSGIHRKTNNNIKSNIASRRSLNLTRVDPYG